MYEHSVINGSLTNPLCRPRSCLDIIIAKILIKQHPKLNILIYCSIKFNA